MAMWSSRIAAVISLAAGLLLLSGCSGDDVQNEYSRRHAYFSYSQVITTHPLYSALTSPGLYCLIYQNGANLVFASLTSSLSVPITAVAQYQRFQSVDGFIVGQSNELDMKTGQMTIYCFDRACPNCYRDDAVTRPLALKENGFAYCSRCKRTYYLNSGGLIYSGDKEVKLDRYRIYYTGSNTMTISN